MTDAPSTPGAGPPSGLTALDGPLAWLELVRPAGSADGPGPLADAAAPLALGAPGAPGGAAALAFTPAGEEALRRLLPGLPAGVRVARLAADDWRAKAEAFRAAVDAGAGEIWLDAAPPEGGGEGGLEPRVRVASHRAALYALSYKTGTACL